MVYKPTGRPPGRPKTKEYVTLMARVDGVLADQVKRYAALHRQPLSVVIRDALTLLMEEYPPGAPLSGPHPLTEHEFPSDRYESPLDTLVGETDSAGFAELLSDTNNFAIETILSDANRDKEYLYDMKGDEERASEAQKDEIVSDTNATEESPPYDTAKYVLGKLCPGRHEHGSTGESLLRLPKRQCDICKKASNTTYRQARKQRSDGQ